MELVEKFIKLIAGLINHLRENVQSRMNEIAEYEIATTKAPVVTTYVSHSEFVGEYNKLCHFAKDKYAKCMHVKTIKNLM